MANVKYFLLAAVVGLWLPASAAQSKCFDRRTFSGDDDSCLDAAPSPSPAIIAAILTTDAAGQEFDDGNSVERARISKLLKGLVVHLSTERRVDLIVRGDFPMSGGDNTWFWIVTSAENKPVATWVQCNTVTVLRSRHNGYRDIRTDWFAGSHSETQVFRFNGHTYKLFRERYRDLPPGR